MSAPDASVPVFDAATFLRVQQANQVEIISKLLHDLRNPVHSMRITVELFSRIVQPGADVAALLTRAGRYVIPAESALVALGAHMERLSTYLGAPRRPTLDSIEVNALLRETGTLLRDSRRSLQVDLRSGVADGLTVKADRPRISHALLAWGLQSDGAPVNLHAEDSEEGVVLSVRNGRPLSVEASTGADLAALIHTAGGRVLSSGQALTGAAFPRG